MRITKPEQLDQFVTNQMSLRERLSIGGETASDTIAQLDEACGYPTSIDVGDYKELIESEGIAGRVNDVFAEECWALDPMIYDTEQQTVTEFDQSWLDLAQRLNIYFEWEKADRLAGIGSFGVMFLGWSDGRNMNQPVVSIDNKGVYQRVYKKDLDLLYVMPLDRTCVTISRIDKDKRSRRYGLPEMYQLKFANCDDVTGDVSYESFDCHWSRIQHLADNLTTSRYLGIPRLKRTFNRIIDMKKTVGGSAEMFWKGAFPGMSFEALPEIAMSEVEWDKEGMKEQIRKWDEGLQRYVTLIGMTAKSLAPQVADPESHVRVELGLIAASVPVPLKILMGSEEAKLAASQDVKNHHKRVHRRRLRYNTPQQVRPLVDLCVAVGAIQKPMKNKKTKASPYTVYWPDLNEMGENDVATTAVKKADALSKFVASNIEQVMPAREFFTDILGMTIPQADAIINAAEKQKKDKSNLIPTAADEAKSIMKATGVPPGGAGKVPGGKPLSGKSKAGKPQKGGGPLNKSKIASKSIRSPGPKTSSSV